VADVLALSGYLYPDRFGLMPFDALEEIPERNGLNAVFNMAGLSQFMNSLLLMSSTKASTLSRC